MALPERRDSGLRTFNEQGALNAMLGQLGFDLVTGLTDIHVAGNGNPVLKGVIEEGAEFASDDLTLTVDDGTAFTDETHCIIADSVETLTGGGLRITGEIVKVTNIVGNDLTVTRGVGGSTAAAHADGSAIYELEGIPHDGRNGTDLVRQWTYAWAIDDPAKITAVNRLGDDIENRQLLEGEINGIKLTAVSINCTSLSGTQCLVAYRG